MKKSGKIITYEIGDIYDYGFPMEVSQELTCYESDGISIQFYCVQQGNKKKVVIVHIESKTPGSGKFDGILKEFCERFKKADEVCVVNVVNGGLIKYFKKNNIKLYR